MKRETGPETIDRVLSAYEVGRKLRQLRLRKKIALADLGKHTGLSPSMLSQLENGKMIPTLPTLARIAMVFDVGLDHFFGGQRARKLFSVIRSQERMRFPERPDAPSPSYFFECLTFASQGKGLQAYLAEFPHRSAARGGEHIHEGVEFLFLLEGTLTIRFQDEDHEIHAGDSVVLDPTEPHSYRGSGKSGARALVVTLPPPA
jgi:transcriptional regulator with XRE-family HTH domain